jgi:hypothetical protein
VFYFINTCLAIRSVAATFAQHYGRQVLTEVLPRIKGVYPKKMMRQLAPVMQRLFAQDMEGIPSIALDILLQVRRAAAACYCVDCLVHASRSGLPIQFQLSISAPILFRR